MLAFILSWLTPTSLFIFLNLTIGTLVISHRFCKTPQQQPQHDHFGRPPSLLERVRSFDFSHYNFQPDHPEPHQVTENPTGLVRTPSFMERLRSINFSHYNFQHHYPEPEHVTEYPAPDNPTGLVRTPSFMERLRSFNFSQNDFQQPDPEPEHVTEHPTPENPTGIVRTPSLLARLKSMDFSSLYRSDPETEDLHPTKADNLNPKPTRDHMVHRSKSDRGHEGSEIRPEKVIKKSASERGFEENEGGVRQRRGVEKTMSFGDDEEVDAKADDFINRFKQQLKLQRLDSLLRYKEMLQRN
ncbi:pathogen-associated molecular patterns-induced protein A70 [Rosa sericea]